MMVAFSAPKSTRTYYISLISSDIAAYLVDVSLVFTLYASLMSYSALFRSDCIEPKDDSTISPLFF